MHDSREQLKKISLNFILILGCMLLAVTGQSAERMVLCEEFTNKY